MIEATANVYLDELRPKKNDQCSVKIKVTYDRKRRYFSTGIDLLPDEFEKIMQPEGNGKRKTKEQKQTYQKILFYLNKANEAIKNLTVFTFDGFEQFYFEKRNVTNSVSFAFDRYIEQLKTEKRLSTAESYDTAKKSLERFKKNVSFADVTPKFLSKYENWMLENGKSITTIGIYLRSLRSIYNMQNIDKSIYPFGEGENKYTIPTGANTKKALSIDEISSIYNYEAPEYSTKEMAKDYWLFLYLSNGMNVKDFCLLKWSNIDDNILSYKREKTKRSRKKGKLIAVALKPETWSIIKKWGQPSITKDAYIFPHLKPGMTAEDEKATIKQLTKTINKYMKRIAIELKIDKIITTYFARHSFATVLKRSGANVGLISELLGHSSVLVTENYLDSFEKEHIQEQTNVLTAGFKKAN
ncbi:site-specific integrase [Natronoflexus pectinivorans]|uniref:Site-specific recombinase XerD n=1 Tax=Natronoflexus pectinivorans TaxID=682526 RepID=A0A4R2GIC1_9BACT|nr:site-specific integrase [Natronoflexus pectinivorans]TCO07034.1 site-specific recombinase XerD [Natronoflexus pectinivorans]